MSILKIDTPYVIVSVVTPETDDPATSGRIVNHHCAPTISHESLEQTGPNRWTLRAAYRDVGYVQLLDLYAQERNTEGAAAWVKYIADGQAGKRVKPFPREKLPREVIRRQACGETDREQALDDANRTAPVTAKAARGRTAPGSFGVPSCPAEER